MLRYHLKLLILLLVISPATLAKQSIPQSKDRFWFSAEYLAWTIKDAPEPTPLVTSGSLIAEIPGAIGQVGTRVVMGGKSIDSSFHSGGRFSMGYWIDEDYKYGIEGTYLFLSPNSDNHTINTSGLPGSPTLAVPIFDISGFTSEHHSPGESVYVLPGPFSTGPGFTGNFTVAIENRLQSAELMGLFKIKEVNCFRMDFLAGLRWVQFREKFVFDVNTSGVSGGPTAGQFFNSHDLFDNVDNFYGFNFGLQTKYDSSQIYGLASARLAVGNMNESVQINGSSSTSNGTLFFPVNRAAGRVINGGIFAQPSNIGHHSNNIFAVVPELDLQLGYHLLKNLSVFTSYNIVYISNLARPGNLINRNINTTRTALANASRASGSGIAAGGPAGPNINFLNTSFWAQGVSFGLTFSY
ncbi:MAG: BBP7 family outer membrane beta-barrel protein [Gammaproteobacteria bacterium]